MRIVGHRGARGEAPENTLGGFRHLRALGIRAVEFDIHVAGDGQLVVIHDATLDRTTDGIGAVGEHDADSLARCNAAIGHPDWPAFEPVPTLAQVLAELDDFTHIELEVKARSSEDEAMVIEQLPLHWARFGLAGRARTTSFNPRYLHGMQHAHPDIPRGFLFEDDFAGDPVAMALALGCTALGPAQRRCTPELMQTAKAAGLFVSTWTVNDRDRTRALRDMGVDALITDQPSAALTWLD